MSSMLAVTAIVVLMGPPNVFAEKEDVANWRQRGAVESSKTAGSTSDDVAEEIRFGREIAARIIGRYGLYQNNELMRYVNLVGLSIAKGTERQEIAFHFAILNTDEINAYAAPGGYIFVTKGLLKQMQDESELAGALAHEISHITQKHIVREMNIHATDSSATAGFAQLIGGTTQSARTAFAQAVEKALDILLKDGYKREDEAQADKTSVTYVAMAGYDPGALGRLLNRIGPLKEKATEVLDKTHPGYLDRITWLDAAIKQDGLEGADGKTEKERFVAAMKTVR